MSVIQLVNQDPQKEWYGSSTKHCFTIGALLPIQRIGLAPMRSFEGCSCSNCGNYIFPVFSGTTDCTSDKSYYLFDFPVASGNDFRLEKYNYGTKLWVDVVAVSGLGNFFPFGVFASYPNRSGFEVQWNNVFVAYGKGTYRFALTPTIQPDPLNPIKINSFTYQLMEYTCEAANYTVKVKTDFNGKVGSLLDVEVPHDLYDMNWNDEIRYYGSFSRFTPNFTDTYVTQYTNKNFLHQSFVRPSFNLNLPNLDAELFQRISVYGKNSDVQITDYNKTTGYNYKDELVYISDSAAEQVPRQKTVTANISCTSRFDIEFDRR